MERDKQITEIFLAVCDLPVEGRAAYLEVACEGDAGLRAEVESLLKHDDPSSLIENSNGPDGSSSPPVATNGPSVAGDPKSLPPRLGRYVIERVLGQGGFGVVCLAQDEQLDRQVAIKMPHARLVSRSQDAEAYLTEARTVAGLDHPNIVPVYDVGSSDECPCYIVSKYIEGTDLARRIKDDPLSDLESIELVATVSEALQYAHKQGLVHRDIKPGNILIGSDGEPYIVDFGVALREENIGKVASYAGTPAYMSPEQASGEGHRVDGRSDLFSLGVVLYELLVGRRPFGGDTISELAMQITTLEPRPLRQYDDHIDSELERICLKTLAKRASDRYSTGGDLADDLLHFLAVRAKPDPSATEQRSHWSGAPDRRWTAGPSSKSGPSSGPAASESEGLITDTPAGKTTARDTRPSSGSLSSSQQIKIVPKGLRSFDAHDADFFLELLPGPRDRNGLPDSLRFWKSRIEEHDSDHTFSVGLIYGPSGCGKSSLVRAGLLPRLSHEVLPLYIEATSDETETRLLRELRKRCPGLDGNLNLKETLIAVRRGQGISVGKKVLIIIDQFEQWLHARKEQQNSELVQALRQCDGGQLQCIVMVRDDFWMAATRFMRELEIRLLEGENSGAVDLFLPRHAERVLKAYGRAFGELPESPQQPSRQQNDFVQRSVAGLAVEGKVICVRLALFAEMMKGKPWTPATLREVGGTAGIGVTFLEETFSASTAPQQHRYHQQAARAVLHALLPESGANIKGQMKSYQELLTASGYTRQIDDFNDLIRILDNGLRLITPTDGSSAENPETGNPETDNPQPSSPNYFYQLTHDYLVNSLRDWLSRKQKETRRGRAELQLLDRSATWNVKPENRQLPSIGESIRFRLLADSKNWTDAQRSMMRRAAHVHVIRFFIVATLLAIVCFAGVSMRYTVVAEQNRVREENLESQNTTRAEGLVRGLLNADIAQLPTLVEEIEPYRKWADPILQAEYQRAADGSSARLRSALALLGTGGSHENYLTAQLPTSTVDDFPVLCKALVPSIDQTETFWLIAEDPQQESQQRFQAAAALATYAPADDRWNPIAHFVSQHLTAEIPSVYFFTWLDRLRPARGHLYEPLMQILADRGRPEKQLDVTAIALADYLHDKPDKLADAILVAGQPTELAVLIDASRPHVQHIKPRLLDTLQAPLPSGGNAATRDAHWKRQSMAAVALVQLGHADGVWPLLKFSPDPSLRSMIIDQLGSLRADHIPRAAKLETEHDASIRQALIESFGGQDKESIPGVDRVRIVEQLKALFQIDPDPGVHSSASWAISQWGLAPPRLTKGEVSGDLPATRRWYINSQSQTMIVIPRHQSSITKGIDHDFAMGSREVTIAEIRKFSPRYSVKETAANGGFPAYQVSWYLAAQYCNWLSGQDGIAADQWIYGPNANGRLLDGMTVKTNYRELAGYRLPTGAEWEHVCRAGTTSVFSFGAPESLIVHYGQTIATSKGLNQPGGSLLPNRLGLFDMHGSLWEWCLDSSKVQLSPVRARNSRVLRGGSYGRRPWNARSEQSVGNPPTYKDNFIGFRVAKSLPGLDGAE